MCNKKKHFLILLKKLIICIKNIERIKFCVITRSINRFPHKWNVKDSKLFIQKTAVPMLSSTSWFAEIVEFSSNKFSRHRTLSVWSISPVRFDQVPILPLTPISIIHSLLPPSVPDKVSITLRVAMQFRFYNAALVCMYTMRAIDSYESWWKVMREAAHPFPTVDRSVLLARSVEKISINLSSTVAFSINLWFIFHQNTWEIGARSYP